MGLRELKETAHAQYIRGRFEQCARTYLQILKLAPKDPNMRVRHAEACRRAGDRLQAIASYRMAADLLLAVGCESRARGAIKAALELDPRDPVLLADLARLGQGGFPATPGLEEERHASGPMKSWGTSAVPGRSMTSAAIPAPRSQTSLGVPTPPARSLTSAGAPAAGLGRSVTSTSMPAPTPARSVTSTLPAASPVTLPRGSAYVSGVPVQPSAMVPVASAQGAGSAVRRTPPPLPSAAREPAWVPLGASAPSLGQGSTPAPMGHRGPPAPPAACASAPVATPSSSSVTPPPLPGPEQGVRLQAEVRRLSPHAVAFRLSPRSRWVLFSSRAPIQVRRVDSLESLPADVRDFSLDITVEAPEDEDSVH